MDEGGHRLIEIDNREHKDPISSHQILCQNTYPGSETGSGYMKTIFSCTYLLPEAILARQTGKQSKPGSATCGSLTLVNLLTTIWRLSFQL